EGLQRLGPGTMSRRHTPTACAAPFLARRPSAKPPRWTAAAAFLAGLISILPLSANAASSTAQVRASDSVEYNVNVTTWRDIPFRSVVRQQYDFSCGSAAVATLLSYQFHRPTSEQDVFKVMWNAGDQQLIRKVGFSMFDMKSYLSSLGYDADGYRLSLDRLAELKTPAIALIQIGRYKHFVVIKGVHADRVLVGDPALGLLTIDRSKFQSIWNGLVFVIH